MYQRMLNRLPAEQACMPEAYGDLTTLAVVVVVVVVVVVAAQSPQTAQMVTPAEL